MLTRTCLLIVALCACYTEPVRDGCDRIVDADSSPERPELPVAIANGWDLPREDVRGRSTYQPVPPTAPELRRMFPEAVECRGLVRRSGATNVVVLGRDQEIEVMYRWPERWLKTPTIARVTGILFWRSSQSDGPFGQGVLIPKGPPTFISPRQVSSASEWRQMLAGGSPDALETRPPWGLVAEHVLLRGRVLHTGPLFKPGTPLLDLGFARVLLEESSLLGASDRDVVIVADVHRIQARDPDEISLWTAIVVSQGR